MLARLARDIPLGDYAYEPKWDGFRALVFRDGADVDIRSRHDRPFARYFPELVAAIRQLSVDGAVIDGEIVVIGRDRFDFPALMLRLHPTASRVERLSVDTPAMFIAFDVLAADGDDLRARPFVERRARLARVLEGAVDRLRLTPATDDAAVAAGWLRGVSGGGIDGVVAKQRTLPYVPGKRVMTKVKAERTADCVAAGLRLVVDGNGVASVLLGLYDELGELRHVGVTASFTQARRRELLDELTPLVTALAGHPWERGFGLGRSPTGRLAGSAGRWDPREMPLDWIPLRPDRVCEVVYDTLDGERFRHPATFRRWRPDREARSCTYEQLVSEPTATLADVLVPDRAG
ncbi:MAG: ATP-dependent DNA ligase [Chloroflexota bacterium]|nr:ATP-dependent DNA ligase [Chloroflexota bacterium]